jgi:hypothetical protein
MPLLYGVHQTLEAEADRILHDALAPIKSMEAKKDILTPWKLKDRKDREVLVASGVPDAAIRQGNFHRAWNRNQPYLNSRGTLVPSRRYEANVHNDNRADEFGDHDSWEE